MVSKSIVGRFLILAVLLVSLGVIAQAAMIISKEPTRKAMATSDAPPAAAASPAVATAAAMPAAPAVAAQPVQAAEAAPVRVVYPGPLGDAPVLSHKIADAAPASPLTPPASAQPAPVAPIAVPAPAVPVQAQAPTAPIQPQAPTAPVQAQAPTAPVQAQAPAGPAPAVEVASAEPGAAASAVPPTADGASAGRGVNLNSASVEALNHIGAGHIGQSIVQHRPYKSVEDLVKKRVVRRSVYEQIKNQVAAE